MNSVIEIGDYIMFLYQGEKKWEGNNENIFDAEVPELRALGFANKLLRDLKKK